MKDNTSTTEEELDEYLCVDCGCPESYHSSLKKRVCHKHHETPCAGFDNGLKKPDDPLDKIITAYFIAVTYINEYGGSGKSDKQGEEAYKEARDEARQALHSAILSRMPEKMISKTGIENKYDYLKSGYNAALTDITQVLNDFFGGSK